MAKRETVAQAHTRGYDEGFTAGARAAQKAAEERYKLRDSQLELMRAVSNLVAQASQAVGALASVYDNGPRN